MVSCCDLIKPDISYYFELISLRDEIIAEDGIRGRSGSLERMKNIPQWLDFNKRLENAYTVPAGWVESEQFIYVRKSDHRIVGMILFRHYVNDFLGPYVGHIGYSVRPSERRKGYGTQMLADCLKVCKDFGLEHVLVTCSPDNEGSKKIILTNKGVYEGKVYYAMEDIYLNRYWITIADLDNDDSESTGHDNEDSKISDFANRDHEDA